MPRNLSGREYNGMNAIMLLMHCEKQGYKMPVFCTFDRVAGLNGAKDGRELPHVGVNKGEKSFPVFITVFTVVNDETKERIKYEEWKNLTEEERQKYSVYPKLQVYQVFNIDQTNLKEARPEMYDKIAKGQKTTRPEDRGEEFSFEPVDRMINENLWICPIKSTYGDEAYFSISQKVIVVPEKKQFVNDESFYSNLFHEMAHSTGTEEYLNRLKPSSFGSKEYAKDYPKTYIMRNGFSNYLNMCT